jgi:hypothetical protein
MKIFHEQLQIVRSPRDVIERLASNPRAAFVGFRHILFLAVLWEFALLFWVLGGATVTIPAFLRIPEDQYYSYQLLFFIPMFLVTWLLASSIAYVLSKAIGGSGTCDAILGGFGMSAAVSGYFVLIPDYIQGLLWTTGWIPFAEYQELTSQGPLAVLVAGYLLAYSVAHLVLYSATIHYSQHLSRSKSVFVATIAYFVSIFFFMIINR